MTSRSENVTQPPLAHHDSRLLDLAFAMDTTGSMGSYIDTACNSIRQIVEEIVAKESSDVRLALVEYRDHPPQELSYVTQVHDFTDRVAEMKCWLDASNASGGGDTPEAVADALHDVLKLSWRAKATKICVLVSDAPPHGLQDRGDGFPNGCPAGHDPMAICRKLAEKGVTLYVAGCEPALRRYKDFFAALAYVTGGQYVPLSAARALTQVIIGGAQEELSLEQWMEQVNQEVLQQVQERGAANVNVEDLSRDVMSRLNVAGAKSKRLEMNSAPMASASGYAKDVSRCADMSAVKSEWKKAGRDTSSDFPTRAMFMSAAAPAPMGGAPERSSRYRSAMPTRSAGPETDDFRRNAPMHMAIASEPTYETKEADVDFAQAERMVQKALFRNKIDLSKE